MKSATRISMAICTAAACAAFAIDAHADNTFRQANAKQHEQRTPGLEDRLLCERQNKGDFLARTELLFGLSRATGPDITEAEFQKFIDTEVTPRFPDGLTLLTGNGQFKDSGGSIIRERSKLLVLFYPLNKPRSRLVDEIREAYKTAFQQESVLRVDEHSCVSF